MTKAQRKQFDEGKTRYCLSLFVSGFTFPDINGMYRLKAFSDNIAYYRCDGSEYGLMFIGKSHLNYDKVQIVSCHDKDKIVAYKDSKLNIWFDYFGDCYPTIMKYQ